MNIKIRLNEFTPAEAALATGVSAVQQRDWRRRGFLPQNEGHARFDACEIAAMWTMRLLSDRGVGPSETGEIAKWAAAGIVSASCKWVDAFGLATSGIPGDNISWKRRAEFLKQKVLRSAGYNLEPAPFLIWWANGAHTFHFSVDQAFKEHLSDDERYVGPVIVLDLASLGTDLLKRLSKPFATIEISGDIAGGGPS